MERETRIALMNYDWMLENRRDVAIAWDSDTLVYGDGGVHLDELTVVGFTPATENFDLRPGMRKHDPSLGILTLRYGGMDRHLHLFHWEAADGTVVPCDEYELASLRSEAP